MRKADLYLLFVSTSLLALGLIFIHTSSFDSRAIVQENRRVVKLYGLTDLALFSEARYTRHPSMADLGSSFQDHPAALEHFPSGSLMAPPLGSRR